MSTGTNSFDNLSERVALDTVDTYDHIAHTDLWDRLPRWVLDAVGKLLESLDQSSEQRAAQ